MKWELTDLEFQALCDRYRGGRMPRPFRFTSRIVLEDDYEREMFETRTRLDAELGPGFGVEFETIANPEVWVGIQAWIDTDFRNPATRLRLAGARRGRRAFVIKQEPAESLEHCGNITLLECEPEAMPALLIAQLPPREAGWRPAVSIVKEPPPPDLYASSASAAFDSFEDTTEAQSLAFLSTPAELTGAVRVVQGRSKYGPRGRAKATLVWRDLADDGRYLIDVDPETPIAVGVDAHKFSSYLAGCIDRILQQMEWRGDYDE
ncbi:ESX secretion-associated protein EspG [Nocardia sp. CDC153]|uniref:ESX secretion-associated protein EspG n=1 Tax=Nocardia sp. CDC153 TaxID=3112167 RepID=UPI002DB7CACB|nr:ESX secretion-associated protein EspG [Nocardia sp. CDC153]MEC3955056.1 ESX secretion-associated protein EspG [Nocardia sp. CDC153]